MSASKCCPLFTNRRTEGKKYESSEVLSQYGVQRGVPGFEARFLIVTVLVSSSLVNAKSPTALGSAQEQEGEVLSF